MGSNGGEESMISGSNAAICSQATVEIKIKTLDSQTYTLQVDKCVPVPALKEQIATVTGILSDQQRLICRGKVLKDDQLLSAYHVEDGHTLHLVVREPIPPPSESFPDNPATDPASSADQSHGHQMGPGVLVGSFNISELGDGTFQDLGRIVSAVLGSFGVAEFGSSGEGVDPQAPNLERVSRPTGPGGSTNSGRQQPNQTGTRSGFPHQAAFSLDPMHPPVIPDSLTTLTQYLSHMRQEFSANAGDQTNLSQDPVSDGQNSDAASGLAARRGGLPTPASLAEVMRSTRQFLNEQAGECLSQLTRQIEDHASMTDTMARMRIQSNAMRTGSLLQNLGALLLELGRTTMTLQIGQTPADAVVNAGPAVFISTLGPNPIMVQPLPFQPGASFGTIPVGTAQPGSGPGLSSGSVGASGFLPRSIDIRIRTGSVMASTAANPREPTAGQPVGQSQTNPAAPASENFANQATAGPTGGQSAVRRSEVRVIPLRTVLTAVPAHVGPTPSNPSRGSMGLFYPVISRDTTSGNVNITRGQASGQPTPNGVDTAQQSMPTAAAQEPSTQVPRADVSHGQLDQFFRILAGVDPISANGNVEAARAANNSQEIAPSPAGEEGTFLSNLLRQIIPAISQHTTQTSNSSVDGDNVMEDRTAQNSSAQDNSDRGTTSRRRNAPQSPESSKRQKREQ